jgi:hypothetical protein
MNCSDEKTLQALMCMIIYLQALGMIPTCYSYISLAMAASKRMGLHRSDSLTKLNIVERETHKRIFWALRTMEAYITTILDLPKTLSDEDTDQEFPGEIEDCPMSKPNTQGFIYSSARSMGFANAHTRLLMIMSKLKRFILGSGKPDSGEGGKYRVDYAQIVEVEKELESWILELPEESGLHEAAATKLDM